MVHSVKYHNSTPLVTGCNNRSTDHCLLSLPFPLRYDWPPALISDRINRNPYEKAASLPLSTIENIGITSIECILLSVTLFLFCRYLLNRNPTLLSVRLQRYFCSCLQEQFNIPVRKTARFCLQYHRSYYCRYQNRQST